MELAVVKIDGKKTSKKVKLDDSVFGIEPNDHAIYLDVKLTQANKRQGTHQSRERGEVRGSTKKIKKQKGTGTARAGSIKSPLFRGGGRAFGPRPRNYGFKLNKKLRKIARKSALTYKAKDNQITILEDFTFDEPKTKSYLEMINSLDLSGKKTLLVLPEVNKNIYLSSRNIQGSNIVLAKDLNTYDILNANQVLIAESSVKLIEETLN